MDTQTSRARREDRWRSIRRRRRTGIAVITALLGATIAVVVLASGSREHPSAHSASASPVRTRSRPGPHTPASVAGGARARTPGTTPVPILMYHVIAAPPPGAPFPGLYVTAAQFAEQMHALARAGWHAVTQDQIEANWRRGVPLGTGKPIVISFDNGYQSQFTHALPVLRELGWVGVENIQLSGLPPSQGGLGPGEVRGLLAAGWELDTQGFSHADLIALGAEQLHYQVAVARKTLQRRYHVPVNWFCYPSGHYDDTVVAAVKAAGYTGSTTVVPGWARPDSDPYRLHRLRVLGGTSGAQLLALVNATRADPPAPNAYGGA